jgi:hypothetical protein
VEIIIGNRSIGQSVAKWALVLVALGLLMVPGDALRGPDIATTFNMVGARMACEADPTTRGCLRDIR